MSLESHARRPQKSSENKLQLELKNIKNYIFENFKDLKITQKYQKT